MRHSPPPHHLPQLKLKVLSCKLLFAKSNLNGLEGWQPFPVNGFARDLVPSWHTSLLQEAATRQSDYRLQLLLHISAITAEIFCIPAVYFIHNVIGCIQWRSGRLASNLVTSTSGLNKLCAKKQLDDTLYTYFIIKTKPCSSDIWSMWLFLLIRWLHGVSSSFEVVKYFIILQLQSKTKCESFSNSRSYDCL